MTRKPLVAAFIAAAFVLPLTANAGGTDKHAGAKQASANGANDGGAAAMFKSMDKNGDGFISKEEAKGSPHEAQFASLDKNRDGKLSQAEHAAAPEHAKAASSSNPSTASTDKASTPAGVSSPGTSPAMPNSPPPAGNTKGQANKTY